MVVKLSYNGKEYETTTDENGTYRIPFADVFGKKAKLTLVMQCREEQVIYFTIISNTNPITPHIYRTSSPYEQMMTSSMMPSFRTNSEARSFWDTYSEEWWKQLPSIPKY